MSNVLITGVNGFVGQHVAKELADHGMTVLGVGGPQGASNVSSAIQEYKVIELTDPAEAKTIDFTKVDSVIHLAGLAAVAPSFDAPLDYLNTNIGIEVNLFESALAQNCRPRFLIISSGSLYDPGATLPLTETSPVLPSSPYAVSKIGQEQMASYYHGRGFAVMVARPFNHIGPGQGLGFIVPDLTQQVLTVAAGKVDHVAVGNLDSKRDYTDVRDIARAYRLLLEKGQPGEIYNICSGEPRSGHDILAAILKAAGSDPKIEQDPSRMRPSDNPEVYGSHQKLHAHTGWQPEIDFATTIADVVADWHSKI